MNLLKIYFEDLYFDQVFKVKRGDVGHLPDFDLFMLASHMHMHTGFSLPPISKSQWRKLVRVNN